MLIFNSKEIGEKLYLIRKREGLTQAELAEKSGLSDRTYADIERGEVNMRIDTVLKICSALKITPDNILTSDNTSYSQRLNELLDLLSVCSENQKETALELLSVYLNSVITK